jgi:predicted Rossmann fold flavoprotein
MHDEFEVAVIGGGPAGMMAAGAAAEAGARVVLIEKNEKLGKKLLITGGGRSNITNAEHDVRVLLSKFKESDQFLFSAFSQWAVKDTIGFFESRGMKTKEEALKRVFPASNSAQSVWDTLAAYLKEGGIEIISRSPVAELIHAEDKIVAAKLKNGKEIRAKKFILATGGYSHPETGSTGDGFEILKALGHAVVPPSTALVPITTSDAWGHKIPGLSFQDIKISLFQNNVKQYSQIGKVLFTHQGLSGPGILNASSEIGELLKYGEVILELDIVPHLSYDTLNAKLLEIFKTHHTKKLKNALADLVPHALIEPLSEISKINFDTPANSVSRDDRNKLVKLLKHIPMHPTGLLGEDKAIITSGGVALEEIDFKTMRSRLYPNLYIVGDLLNIDRPSGGYSLQLCWTTGAVAGKSAAH